MSLMAFAERSVMMWTWFCDSADVGQQYQSLIQHPHESRDETWLVTSFSRLLLLAEHTSSGPSLPVALKQDMAMDSHV